VSNGIGGAMNEKKLYITVFVAAVILGFIFTALLSGCRTVGSYVDEPVLEHQRRIIELEGANRALAERLGQYDKLVERTVSRLEAVRERAAGIGDSADRIEYLFTEYERTVQQLIHELRSNGGQVGKGTEDFESVIYYLALLDGSESFADYCRVYMAGY